VQNAERTTRLSVAGLVFWARISALHMLSCPVLIPPATGWQHTGNKIKLPNLIIEALAKNAILMRV
jgi:hypothetical protein